MKDTEIVFEQGQSVFDGDGKAYIYISPVAAGLGYPGHVCAQIHGGGVDEDDNEEPYFYGAPCVVRQIFPTIEAAKATVDDDIHRAKVILDALNDDLSNVRSKLRQAKAEAREEAERLEREKAERVKRFSSHAALARIEDLISGKITHFVTIEYGCVQVKTRDAVLGSQNRYERDMKLLSLYGASNGDLQWKVNRYSDGSGSWWACHPFCSEADALEFARAELRKEFDEMLHGVVARNGAGIPVCLDNASKSAAALGVEVPAALIDALRAFQLESANDSVAKAKEALAKAQQGLDALLAVADSSTEAL